MIQPVILIFIKMFPSQSESTIFHQSIIHVPLALVTWVPPDCCSGTRNSENFWIWVTLWLSQTAPSLVTLYSFPLGTLTSVVEFVITNSVSEDYFPYHSVYRKCWFCWHCPLSPGLAGWQWVMISSRKDHSWFYPLHCCWWTRDTDVGLGGFWTPVDCHLLGPFGENLHTKKEFRKINLQLHAFLTCMYLQDVDMYITYWTYCNSFCFVGFSLWTHQVFNTQ